MSVIDIARKIAHRYKEQFGVEIDEIKLHKMLYLVQRESLVRFGRVFFSEDICAWKYGPVIPAVRQALHDGTFNSPMPDRPLTQDENDCLDTVYTTYAEKNSWSLSRLTHAEYSWRCARKRVESGGGHRVIHINDIEVDAARIRQRRDWRRAMNLAS